MSTKKYTDFPAGTYDTSKIFLQADPTTGALEKVNLPVIPSITGTPPSIVLLQGPQSTPAFSTTAYLYTYAMPANTLNTNGQALEFRGTFRRSGGTSAMTGGLNVGLASVLGTAVNAYVNFEAWYTITRMSSTEFKYVIKYFTSGLGYIAFQGIYNAMDYTVVNNMNFRISTAADTTLLIDSGMWLLYK